MSSSSSNQSLRSLVGEEQPGSPSPSQRESLSPSMKVIGVLFNIPNIVCHIRIYTGLVAFYYFLSWPIMTIISYSISLNLDNVDGPCARYFNQSSKFGAVYDMIIDRMSTILFMMHLSVLFPQFTLCFAFLSVLDFASHWFQMYAAQISGLDSHKALADHSTVLKLYYGCDPVKFAFSFGFEMFIVCLYISCWGPGSSIPVFSKWFIEFNRKALYYVAFPNFMGRQIVNMFQLVCAAQVITLFDQDQLDQQELNKTKKE